MHWSTKNKKIKLASPKKELGLKTSDQEKRDLDDLMAKLEAASETLTNKVASKIS